VSEQSHGLGGFKVFTAQGYSLRGGSKQGTDSEEPARAWQVLCEGFLQCVVKIKP
jgi:hypothetical protein